MDRKYASVPGIAEDHYPPSTPSPQDTPPLPCSHVGGHLRALLAALVSCVCGYERLLPLVSGCCPERQVTAEASAAGAEGTEPGVVYSSAQTANGLGDIAAPHGGLGAAINQGAPLQQLPPPPRSPVLGGELCQEVCSIPRPGLAST